MAETKTQNKTLRELFEALPIKAKDWLTSERATYYIIDINKKISADGDDIKIIPRLILQLVVGQIAPQNFIHEISQSLGLTFSAAKIVAQEIEEKILRPIEATLRTEAGVDIKLIYVAEEKTASPILKVINEEPSIATKKLIPAPEIAHPEEYRAPVQSPVYSPSAQKPAPAPIPPRPPMPKVEPLPVRPPVAPPTMTIPRVEPLPRPMPSQTAPARPASSPQSVKPQPTYVPKPTTMPGDIKKTAIPFRFEPSRVPKFPPKP